MPEGGRVGEVPGRSVTAVNAYHFTGGPCADLLPESYVWAGHQLDAS